MPGNDVFTIAMVLSAAARGEAITLTPEIMHTAQSGDWHIVCVALGDGNLQLKVEHYGGSPILGTSPKLSNS